MPLVDRRTFLGATLAATAAAFGSSGCKRTAQSPEGAPAAEAFELDELTLADLASGMAQGRWTSRRLAELYLSRIDALDRRGPRLGAVIEVNPDALSLADQLDQERKSKGARGPLHGIPILIKDNINIAGRMSTTAGSLALEGWRPPKDAFVAAGLRAAGALVLGKTNLSEWANFRSFHSTSGWSGKGGQARNPYALDRNPSGSSSGSGVAVAANLCAVAVGTETDGSVVSPSSVNGIVGVKPTLGLVSRSGIIPIAHSQDTAGPMARTVRDAAILLGAMAGADGEDPATAPAAEKAQADYTKFLDAGGLRGARVGVARKFFEKDTALDGFLDHCVDVLKKGGVEIIDPADMPSHGKWSDPEMEVLLYEFKTDLNAYLSSLPPELPAHSLADLIAFNDKNRSREMPWFEQEIFVQAEEKGPLTDKEYLNARQACLRLARQEGIDAVLEKDKLDAIVSLTSSPACLIDWVNGDADSSGCSTPAAVAGYPHITVPAGLFDGLPVGLSFFGTAWSEPVLLRLAYAYEQETKARQKPRFLAGGPAPEPSQQV
jgi:amidase